MVLELNLEVAHVALCFNSYRSALALRNGADLGVLFSSQPVVVVSRTVAKRTNSERVKVHRRSRHPINRIQIRPIFF